MELLQGAGVELLVDVRQNPRSRYEHFNRSPLAGAMNASGIGYEHMASAEFADGLSRLREMAAERRTAIMCAEGDWTICHRRLVADALVADGIRVLHLGPTGSLAEHELNEDAVVGADGSITYPEPQTSLDV